MLNYLIQQYVLIITELIKLKGLKKSEKLIFRFITMIIAQ